MARLLFIVPYVVQRDGVPVGELAQVLGVQPAQIEADIALLCMVGRPPLTPDHLIDVSIEDDVVYVQLDQNLSRPLRFTPQEARALALGASLVGNLGGWGEELTRVLGRLVQHLRPADAQAVLAMRQHVVVQQTGEMAAAHAVLLRRACQRRQGVRMSYYAASRDQQKDYKLKPLALFAHSGADYLVALDAAAQDQEKLFRLDRIGGVQPLEDHFAAVPGFDLEKFRTARLYFGGHNLQARVRFAPHIAHYVRERFAPTDIVRETEQGLEVRVYTASAAWLGRWVLSFGPDAEVLSPPCYRHHMLALCREAAEAYAR